MSAPDPMAELLRHEFIPLTGTGRDVLGSCSCESDARYVAKAHRFHVLAAVKPLADTRERKVVAVVADEILDAVHVLAAALADLPEPYESMAKAAFTFEVAARDRFGVTSTAGYVLACDHATCAALVRASTLAESRAGAAARGWLVGVGDPVVGRVADLCPAHREPHAMEEAA